MSGRDRNQSGPGQSDPSQSDHGQSNHRQADHLQTQYRAAPRLVTPTAMDQRIMQSARITAEARSQSRLSERSSSVGTNWWPKAGALVATFAVVGLGLKLLPPTTSVPESGLDVASNILSEESSTSAISSSGSEASKLGPEIAQVASSDSRASAPAASVANQLETSALSADQVASAIADTDVSTEDENLNVSDASLDDNAMDSDAAGLREIVQSESIPESASDLALQKRTTPVPPAGISEAVNDRRLDPDAENIRKFVAEPNPELAPTGNSTNSGNEELDEIVAESDLPDLADRSVLLRSENSDSKKIAGKSVASGVIRQAPESNQPGQRWLRNLPLQNFTLVLAQSESEAELRELVTLLKLKPPVFTVAHKDGVQWLLLYGNYIDLQLAETAAGEILESRAGALEIRAVRVSEILQQVR